MHNVSSAFGRRNLLAAFNVINQQGKVQMAAPNSIKIDEVEYIRKDAIPETEGEIKIVVLDRGFVYVGQVSQEDDFFIIRNAKNIRQWGTTKGLGELVGGPLQNTKLDNVGTVRAPSRALISLIDVEQAKWKLF